MSRSAQRFTHRDRKQRRPDKFLTEEDERGWTGRSGQHPVNEEEKNYRTHGNGPAGETGNK